MPENSYAKLFELVTLGSLDLPNRIVMAPMGRNFADDGVGRTRISNPNWPNLVREGRFDEIKPYQNVDLYELN